MKHVYCCQNSKAITTGGGQLGCVKLSFMQISHPKLNIKD